MCWGCNNVMDRVATLWDLTYMLQRGLSKHRVVWSANGPISVLRDQGRLQTTDLYKSRP